MDYDKDGDTDILSGSYTGEIYLFERLQGGGEGARFAQGRYLLDTDGGPLLTGTSVTPEAVDMDGDGDLDMVIGTRMDGVFVFENVGTREAPRWSPEGVALRSATGEKIKGSNAHHADWDGDGRRDLITGSERGRVRWYRNTGEAEAPVYEDGIDLVTAPDFEERTEEEGPRAPGLRTKVHVTDWDGDGQQDLLIGDVQWLSYELPPLSSGQRQEQSALRPVYQQAKADYQVAVDERNSHVGQPGGIPEDVLARYKAAGEAYRPTAAAWDEFDRQRTNTHGWVWLLRGQATVEDAAGAASGLDRGTAAQTFGPVTLRASLRPVPDRDQVFHVATTLHLKPGWHVYAQVPAESPFLRTRPKLVLPAGARRSGPWRTDGQANPDPKLEGASWYEGEVTFACEVSLPEADPSLEVSVFFQACNADVCLPTKTLTVSLSP